MRVSVGIVAYNEERTLPLLLADIKKQTYDHTKMEIILIDSMSTDQTREVMNLFKEENNEFENVLIRENAKKKQAYGWNVAIASSNGDVIIRIDAHARIPEDFVPKNIKSIEDGVFVVGGPRPNAVDRPTAWKEVLLMAESSMFGSGIGSCRRKSSERKYVKSVLHGA